MTNRERTLKFIRENSRVILSIHANPIKKADMYESYEPVYWEQRMGKNGTPFILQDMGKNGWDLYFLQGGNELTASLQQFCIITGVEPMRLEDLVKMTVD